MKRMLINATQAEELRMAMVDGQRLYDLNIEGPASERKKANIYKGKITRIEPSLEAAFVDYGAERHGFLPLKEVSSEYFVTEASGKPNIKDVLREGQDIVVQIDKEERGNKGAALTTFVSLAGRFIVLKPNKAHSGGVSRRIVGSDRDLARQSLDEIEIPENMSVILRTAGIERSAEELAWDLENLLAVWQAILDSVLKHPSPFLIYRESNAVIRALRDYLTNEIGEILIDDEATYVEAKEFVEQVMPHNVRKLKHYTDPVPLFTRFQIESQIESAFAHKVNLPSGGSIVIDHTEALVSVDVNSARATKGGDIEATALNTNLEAADEVARQLRIRDLGGLVVIDFIDMGPQKNQREVESRLRAAVRQDRARVQIGKISRFGLLEMSRQRLRPSIGESAYQTCPRCSGFGTIRSTESLALAILRLVGEEARKERTAKVIAQLPVEVATYLLNEKRDWVQELESSNDTEVVLIANALLETPHYDIRRVRDDQADLPENAGASYALAETTTVAEVPSSIKDRKVAEQAAVGIIKPATPAPQRKEEPTGFWAWLTSLFTSDEETPRKQATGTSRRGQKGREDKRGGGSPSRGRGRSDDGQASGKKRSKKKKTAKKSGSAQDGRKPAENKSSKKSRQGRKSGSEQQQGAAKTANAADAGGDEQQKPPRKRRSRGGRRRRRSSDSSGAQDQQNQSTAEASQGEAPVDRPAEDAGKKPAARKPRARKAKAEEANDKPADAGNETPKKESATPKETTSEAAVQQAVADNRSEAQAKAPQESGANPEKADRKESKPPAPKGQEGNGGDGGNKGRPLASAGEKSESGGSKLLPWEPVTPPSESGSKESAGDRSGSAS
jgi:ribonuclease E